MQNEALICTFCKPNVSIKKFQKHLARHLEQVALYVLGAPNLGGYTGKSEDAIQEIPSTSDHSSESDDSRSVTESTVDWDRFDDENNALRGDVTFEEGYDNIVTTIKANAGTASQASEIHEPKVVSHVANQHVETPITHYFANHERNSDPGDYDAG